MYTIKQDQCNDKFISCMKLFWVHSILNFYISKRISEKQRKKTLRLYMKDFICTISCTDYPEIAHIASTVFLHFTAHNIQFDNSFVNNVHLSKCVRWLIDLPFGILNWINYYRVQTEPKCWRRNGTTELVNCVGIHNPRHYIPPFAEANMETTWDYHEYEISLI